MTVFFHGNFGLDRGRMAEITKLCITDPHSSDLNNAKLFGYGAPFAAKYRYWLHKTGISQLGRPFRLTKLGQLVWENDPQFTNDVTSWFMHHELTIDPVRAEAWHFFIYEFQQENHTFTKDTLLNALMMKMRHHDEAHFGPTSKMNPIIVRKLIECYTEPKALGKLGIVCSDDNVNFRFAQPKVQGPWTTKDDFLNAYAKGIK